MIFCLLVYLLAADAAITSRRHRMMIIITWLLNDRVEDDSSDSDGRALSWRVKTLWKYAPWSTTSDRQAAWDSHSNSELSSSSPLWFCDPENPHARILAVRGDGTAYDRAIGAFMESTGPESDTIVVIEWHSDTFVWTQPGDLLIATSEVKGVVSPFSLVKQPSDYFIAFADGTVWLMSRNTPIDAIEPFLTIRGAIQNDRDTKLAAYRINTASCLGLN